MEVGTDKLNTKRASKMTELALQLPTEQHSSERTVETERSLLASQLLNSFRDCLTAAKSRGLLDSTIHYVEHQNLQNGLKSILDDMAHNDARYVQVFSLADKKSIKYILALQRESGNQSILTLFQIQAGDNGIDHAEVVQEVADKGLDFNSQLIIKCDPNRVDSASLSLVTKKREDSGKKQSKDGKDCMQALEEVTKKAVAQPIEKVVTRSVTSERDIIKASKHKRSRAKALGAAVGHIPDFYKEERSPA